MSGERLDGLHVSLTDSHGFCGRIVMVSKRMQGPRWDGGRSGFAGFGASWKRMSALVVGRVAGPGFPVAGLGHYRH